MYVSVSLSGKNPIAKIRIIKIESIKLVKLTTQKIALSIWQIGKDCMNSVSLRKMVRSVFKCAIHDQTSSLKNRLQIGAVGQEHKWRRKVAVIADNVALLAGQSDA
jgi:hypothetical protein